jgi:hypothetical protein
MKSVLIGGFVLVAAAVIFAPFAPDLWKEHKEERLMISAANRECDEALYRITGEKESPWSEIERYGDSVVVRYGKIHDLSCWYKNWQVTEWTSIDRMINGRFSRLMPYDIKEVLAQIKAE